MNKSLVNIEQALTPENSKKFQKHLGSLLETTQIARSMPIIMLQELPLSELVQETFNKKVELPELGLDEFDKKVGQFG